VCLGWYFSHFLGLFVAGHSRASSWLDTGDFLNRSGDPTEWAAKIRQVDQRQEQARDPKDMHVCEQRDKAQDRDHLELHLVGLMRYSIGQSMQVKKQDTE